MTPAEKRNAVAHLVTTHGMSERRTCKAAGFCRMTIRCETTRPDDRVLRERLTELARERRRFGKRSGDASHRPIFRSVIDHAG